MPFMRPCFTEQRIYIEASNGYYATDKIENAYAIIELDSMLNFETANASYIELGDNKFRFDLGDIAPTESKRIEIRAQVNCDANLGEVLCLKADLYPIENCIFEDDIIEEVNTTCESPWNDSRLFVHGFCDGDSIEFKITNKGTDGVNDMSCYSPVRIFVDGVLYFTDSVMLNGGDSRSIKYPSDGKTWRLETDQHQDFLGKSKPNFTIQTCGINKRWLSDFHLALPQDDAQPITDIYCAEVTGSYDPNDKRGFPAGVTDSNFVSPNTPMEYIIRFQNTGTDTAFKVVIQDTLDANFDIASIVSGNASNDYTFKIYGNRVMEWTFDNILLPDSNTNEPESHGFIQYKVKQNRNLKDHTTLENTAYIYFDFNDPIITNTTSHVINRNIYKKSKTPYEFTDGINDLNVVQTSLYPNPTNGIVNINLNNNIHSGEFKVTDINGRIVMKKQFQNESIIQINLNKMNGVFFVEITGENNQYSMHKFVKTK